MVTGEDVGQLPEPDAQIIHVVEKDNVAPLEEVVTYAQGADLTLVPYSDHGGPGDFISMASKPFFMPITPHSSLQKLSKRQRLSCLFEAAQ